LWFFVTCIPEGGIAVSGTGDAEGNFVAVSATGHASGPVAVSGCDTLAEQGRDEACLDPDG